MATGTSAGFFGAKKPQAVLKHTLLGSYMMPFASMAGSTTQRAVILDGFAGEGRYADGSPGSPELMLRTALSLAPARQVECVFVEKSRKSFNSLLAVVTQYAAQGTRARAIHGGVESQLDALVQQARGVPLFMFLDPCGLGVPYETLRLVLTGARSAVFPATEVLMNFSDKAIRHIGGQLAPGAKKTNGLAALDKALGGPWWREVFTAASAASPDDDDAAAQAVVEAFARKFGADMGMDIVAVPVRDREKNLPIYHLVFATRKNHGLWVFGDALARAQREWRAVQYDPEPEDAHEAGFLFSTGDVFELLENQRQVDGTKAITANLERLLAKHNAFKLVDEVTAVFADWYGDAPEKWVRAAVKDLHRRGLTDCEGKGQIRDLVLTRPAQAGTDWRSGIAS